MLSLLFWNILKKPLLDIVSRLVAAHEIDILILAECSETPAEILVSLNRSQSVPFVCPASESRKVKIFTRVLDRAFLEMFDDPIAGVTIRRVDGDHAPGFLLVACHLPSRVRWTTIDQAMYATEVARSIERAEDQVGHRRTILVGDLNMDPYDPGVVGAQALNAVMTRRLAQKRDRRILNHSYRSFYNPMWGFFGDRSPGPPGTYYHRDFNPTDPRWHTFDQVLLRPALMDTLDEIRILESNGPDQLLTRSGLPDVTNGSDHLPLLCRINV